MNDREDEKRTILRQNGLDMVNVYANDPLVVRLENELQARNLTSRDYYKEHIVDIMSWSGLTLGEVRDALAQSKGDYAQEVLDSLQDL